MIEDDDLLKKCDTIWDKIRADIKKGLDSEPVYNKNLFKTKIQSHGDEVSDKEMTKVDSNHTCLAAIPLDSAFKTRVKILRKNLFDILLMTLDSHEKEIKDIKLIFRENNFGKCFLRKKISIFFLNT